MPDEPGSPRRAFLKRAAVSAGIATQAALAQTASRQSAARQAAFSYPRVFEGPQLKMIAFPLGGVAAGSISLGGRGQLRDWEIFNRPNKGYTPSYAFPSIWARVGNRKPVARVLEARILPPYEGASGLGSNNAPGLPRLAAAKFTGEYPLAHIDFEDRSLPVRVSLDAFSPFVPHDAEESGLPVAILSYRVTNPSLTQAQVAIAFSIDNPVTAGAHAESRANVYRSANGLSGLIMTNPGLAAGDPMEGEFVLSAWNTGDAHITYWRGWPKSRWWNAPMLFWDDFSDDGDLGAEPDPRSAVGSISVNRAIAPGATASYIFILSWRFPNRTPEWCGWHAPKGDEKTIIGNHYAQRFPTAWDAAQYAAANLARLESRTRLFAAAIRESTLPAPIKDAATANLSTLASTTCFRTADGEFHGFEGVNDQRGCCFGNCTHVWNYETSTPHLFPSFARSLRKAAFGYSMDDAGAIHFRQLLPDGKERSGFAATDGQMGQIMHAYLDWSLSGDRAWLQEIWPRVKKALEFAWIPGGWDADRDGVLEGVQHNTYDVEFYGPNPMCGIYYLGALRAGEEMAKAAGDNTSAAEYRRLFDRGSRWIDANLFNGEFYVQKIHGLAKDRIAKSLRSDMGSEDTENPQYQVGGGCLVDQLVGQYLADVAGLGPLVSPQHARAALESIYRYNYKRTMIEHDNVQRTFALNDEAALVVCDYGKAPRPRIPFPYYAEVFTGLEYTTASHMLYAGMIREGIECIGSIRARYDGEKRNPWDEAECGHHYARAMAAWSAVLALSGFLYNGAQAAVTVAPRLSQPRFQCFWSTATGWGTFTRVVAGGKTQFSLRVLAGTLPCRTCEIQSAGRSSDARVNGKPVAHRLERRGDRVVAGFAELLTLKEHDELTLEISA
jgi:non-lysosomal glucosylceramidase